MQPTMPCRGKNLWRTPKPFLLYTYCDSRSDQERVSNAMRQKVSIALEIEASTFLCLRAASISLSSWSVKCLHFLVTIALLKVFSIRSCPWENRIARSCECLFDLQASSVDFASFPKSLLLVEHTSAMQALSEGTSQHK